MPRTITPKGWADFQHYKDRRPSWIKLHRDLLDNYDFHRLHVASRALAPCLWLLASEYDDGAIPFDCGLIAFRLRMDESEVLAAVTPLINKGFFIASEVLAECEQDSCLEKRREETYKPEKERELEPSAAPPIADAPPKSPKKKKAEWVTAEHMVSTLSGLTEPVAIGYLEFRRSKGAALTNLAWGSIAAEVLKSGMAPDVALPYAMNRGWQGFDSTWIKPAAQTGNGKPSKHDLSQMDYDKGVGADGRF